MITLQNYLEHLNFTVSQNKNDFLASLYKRYQVNFDIQYNAKTELGMVQMVGIDACMELYDIKGTEKSLIIKYVSNHDFLEMQNKVIPKKIQATVDYAYAVTDSKSIAVLAICEWGKDEDGKKLYNQQIVPVKFSSDANVKVMKTLDEIKNKKVDKRDYEKEISDLKAEVKDLKEVVKDLKEIVKNLKGTVKELSAKLNEALKPNKDNDIFVATEGIEKENQELKEENKNLKDELIKERNAYSILSDQLKILQLKMDNPEHFGYVKVDKKDIEELESIPDVSSLIKEEFKPIPKDEIKKDEKPLDKAIREYDEKEETISIKTRASEWKESTIEQQKVLALLNSYKTEKDKTPKKWNIKTRLNQIEYLKKKQRKLDFNSDHHQIVSEIVASYDLNFN